MSEAQQTSKHGMPPVERDEGLLLPPDHQMPGWTVDALLDKGEVNAAREELERLLMAGIESGPGIPFTESRVNDILSRARERRRPR